MKQLYRITKARAVTVFSLAVATVMTTVVPAIAAELDPTPEAPPGLEEAADKFLGWLKWGGLVGGILGLFICALMMMVGRRNRSSTAVDGATGIPWVLAGLTVMAFAASIVGEVLT
jgi:hypothetical protein